MSSITSITNEVLYITCTENYDLDILKSYFPPTLIARDISIHMPLSKDKFLLGG